MSGGIELPKVEKIRTLGEKEILKHLSIFEANTVKQGDIKEKKCEKYITKTRKLLENRLYRRHLIKGINARAFSARKILETILKLNEGRTTTNGSEKKKTSDNA